MNIIELVFDTIQATVAVIAILFAILSFQISRRAIENSERESNLRIRPWVGILDIQYLADTATGLRDAEVLNIKYHNVGSLPAHNLKLQLTFEPPEWTLHRAKAQERDPEMPLEIVSEMGGIFPNEPGSRTITIRGVSRFFFWRTGPDGKSVIPFTGNIEYELGKASYSTEFRGSISFNVGEPSSMNWANTHMT